MNEKTEEWRPVVGYENAYEVSDLGHVKSLARIVEYKNGRRQGVEGCIMQLHNTCHGYPSVVLSSSGKDTTGQFINL
jgi:hypothetical protein